MSAVQAQVEAMDPEKNTNATMKLENTEKRDALTSVEQKYQKLWKEQGVYEADAPSLSDYPADSMTPKELRAKVPKFFGTMAYPYVNGTPHLGHAFTVSKVEFAARAARAAGKKVLYPQGYHCTGMPIKACADKLTFEVGKFGQNFERYAEEEASTAKENFPPAPTQAETKTDLSKFSNVKKGKAALKTVATKYQFQVMLAIGVPLEEIHKFANPHYWLRYFPQLWEKHLTEFGCGLDWRRSFVTTDANPYYDSFVRWQMRRLRKMKRIDFGKRFTVYSPKDKQPCLDHDRSSGEGINVQEYTGMKLKVKTWAEQARQELSEKLPAGASVYMVAATLRPETMYGQRNLFVAPKIKYGVYKVSETDYFFVTDRAARNMSFQGVFPEWGVYPKVAELEGAKVIGTLVTAPLSTQGDIYVVPMDTIKEGKGTGVVTNVPSDSPDDYAMTMDLNKKAEFYGIKPEWVSLDILPIIKTPDHGDMIAVELVKKMKINSPKDAKQLAEAKEIAYKEGFYRGTMVYGEFTGKSVQEAKPLVRKNLLDSSDAFVYCEPDGEVMSRSGDSCVAAHLDQWFLTYGDGDPEWRQEVLDHVNEKDGETFNSFTSETKHAIQQTLGWMNQWAVTRQFGLGTRLPWDESNLVESLSDSTIYMAYYTVAHFLHKDIYGAQQGTGKIAPEQMNDDVWDYIFALNPEAPKTEIAGPTLEAMRREFTYWYPLDVRISGKDLINNHLIFMLYIHQAIWGRTAPEYLPRGIRINGHATLNGEKMSKSTGNFLTLDNAVSKFGADATRIALADAGDGVEDANFEETVANAVILKLYELRKWIEEAIKEARILKDGETFTQIKDAEKVRNTDIIQRSGAKVFWDELFENEMNSLAQEAITAYDGTFYKTALKTGFYDFTAARDAYRVQATASGIGMHTDCIRLFTSLQAQLLAVIAPHWSDYIWCEVLGKPTTVTLQKFPTIPQSNPTLTAAGQYIRNTTGSIGTAEGMQQKKIAKGKDVKYDPKLPKRLTIFVARNWPGWQEKYLEIVRQQFDGLTFDTKAVGKSIEKADLKKAMPFIQNLKKRLDSGEQGDKVLNRQLGFDELQVLGEMKSALKATVTKLSEVVLVLVDGQGGGAKIEEGGSEGEKVEGLPIVAQGAEPGNPTFEFTNV